MIGAVLGLLAGAWAHVLMLMMKVVQGIVHGVVHRAADVLHVHLICLVHLDVLLVHFALALDIGRCALFFVAVGIEELLCR